MKTTFATLMAAAALAGCTNAFWGTGHLIVSRRAQAILESENPAALDQALTVLSYLKNSSQYSKLTGDEKDHPFTECADFADNIKGQGYSAQSDWHFIDNPYLADGDDISDYPDFEMSDVDVVDALTDLTAFLKGETVSGSTYVKQVQDWFSDENDQQSFALRLVIHYAGDIHQPLHATSEVDHDFPEGDRGGNSQWVPNVGGAGNLHAVWDSVLYEYCGYPDLPLDSDNWDTITDAASSMAKSHPVASSDILSGKFETWSQQSLEISQTVVYPGFVFNQALSDEYQATAKPIIEERIMYGGARLAALIEDIYGESTMARFNKMVFDSFLQ